MTGHRRRVQLAKLLLLALLTAAIVGLVGVYLVRRASRFDPGAAPEARSTLTDEGSAQKGRGVDHTVSHEGKPLFRIRGTSDRQDREGNLQVEDVLITLFRDDGSRYEIAADEATYRLDDKEAMLSGNVSLVGPGGFALETAELELRNNGKILESGGEVRFRYGVENPFEGTAAGFRGAIERSQYFLRGDVAVDSLPEAETPFSLRSDRVLYARKERILRADGDVAMEWGESALRSSQVTAHLHPDEDVLRFVRARWGILLDFRDEAGRRVVAQGDEMLLLFESDGKVPSKLELETQERSRVSRIDFDDLDGTAYRLSGRFLQVEFRDGEPREAKGMGRVRVAEGFVATDLVLRQLCAERASVTFAAEGTVGHLSLEESVQIHEGGEQVLADTITGTPARLEAEGDPALFLGSRGWLRAPTIVATDEGSLVHGSGGVEAELRDPGDEEENPLRQTPLSDRDEPIRVTSEEAFYRDEPRGFLFRGGVRAWSGERVLLAGQLRGDLEARTLSAAEDVETVWFTEPEGDEPPTQVRITAEGMVFDDPSSTLTYERRVELRQEGKILRCRTLEVTLDESGEAKRMTCSDRVVLEAPEQGRTIRADRAEYDVGAGIAVFTGDEVELVDSQGGRLTGRWLRYSLENDTVQVSTEGPPDDARHEAPE